MKTRNARHRNRIQLPARRSFQCRTAPRWSRKLLVEPLEERRLLDAVPPTVTATSLGEEGEHRTAVIDRFTLEFSEDMYHVTVNDVDNLDLREAGLDGAFDTADDDVYTLSDTAYTAGLSAEYRIVDGPLQPGSYRLRVGTGLTDRAGNPLAAEFLRTISVAPLPGCTIEDRDNDTRETATELASQEDPTRLVWAGGQGNLSGPSDVDWWSFTATEGDLLTVGGQVPGLSYDDNAGLYYNIYLPGGASYWDYVDLKWTSADQTLPHELWATGTYTVKVYMDASWGHQGEYWLKVDVVRPPVQMESDWNNDLAYVDELILEPGATGHQVGTVWGRVALGDPADLYRIGQVDEGSTISLSLETPSTGKLSGALELYDEEGTLVHSGPSPLSYTVGAGDAGIYRAAVKAQNDSGGLFSQYLLNVDVSDTRAPEVLRLVLPPEWPFAPEDGCLHRVIDRFTLEFSEDMYHVTVNEMGNLDLREAGADGKFDTADDEVYTLDTLSDTPYTAGLSADYRIVDGPLQPGSYRLTVGTGLTDRAGNPLPAEFVEQFCVKPLPGCKIESRENNTWETATEMVFQEDPTGLVWAGGQGNLSSWYDEDWWSFTATKGDLLSVGGQVPGLPYTSSPWLYYAIRSPDWTCLDRVYLTDNSAGQTPPHVLPDTGTYWVRVYTGASSVHQGEYWLKVDTVSPPVEMETETNDDLAHANELILEPDGSGHQVRTVWGRVALGDAGDFYRIGQVDEGSMISLTLREPSCGTLSGILDVYNPEGDCVAHRTSPLQYPVPPDQGGVYHVAVTAQEGTEGLFSQYLLDADVGPAPTLVTLSVDTAEIPENEGVAIVTATLSEVSDLKVTVDLDFLGDAEKDGDYKDYTVSDTEIRIDPNDLTGNITITACQDPRDEEDVENVVVKIKEVTNATASSPDQVTVGIKDDDDPPLVTLSIDPAKIAENGGVAIVTGTLSEVSDLEVTVDLGFSGAATKDVDYTVSGTQIPIEPRRTTGTIDITAQPDTEAEPDEDVLVDIVGVTNGTESGTQQVKTTILGCLIDVALVPVATLSPSSLPGSELPTPADQIAVGSTYYLEVWVQDHGFPGVGVTGGTVDVHYTTALVDATEVVNLDFDEFPSGTIHDPNGLVDDLGGGTLTAAVGVSPNWARLGYIGLVCTGVGDVTFQLSPGDLKFSRYGQGTVPWDDVDLSGEATVSQVRGIRVDTTLVRDATAFDDPATGEVEALPENLEWIDEWGCSRDKQGQADKGPVYVEIWAGPLASLGCGISSFSFDLAYNTEVFTATSIECGPAFAGDCTGAIDDAAGSVHVQAATTRSDVGDDRNALLAKVLLEFTEEDPGCPHNAQGKYITPLDDPGIGLENVTVALEGTGAGTVELGNPPETDVWPVMYDIDDDDCVGFGDLAFFATAFRKCLGDPDASSFVWASDFELSGCVDFGDLAFFAANFGRCKCDDIPIVYPSDFPDAWQSQGSGTSLTSVGDPLSSWRLATDEAMTPVGALPNRPDLCDPASSQDPDPPEAKAQPGANSARLSDEALGYASWMFDFEEVDSIAGDEDDTTDMAEAVDFLVATGYW